ncbi:MAG: hypothetical protein ACREQ2_13545, partial [Candidatus Binatia bacterium]
MKSRFRFRLVWLCLFQALLIFRTGSGFELETHAVLSHSAIDTSNLENFFANILSFDFPDGLGQQLRLTGELGTVRGLIAEVGSK